MFLWHPWSHTSVLGRLNMRASVKKKNKSQILIKNDFSHVLLDNSPAGELIPQPFTSTFPPVKSMLKEDSCEKLPIAKPEKHHPNYSWNFLFHLCRNPHIILVPALSVAFKVSFIRSFLFTRDCSNTYLITSDF